MSSTNPHDTATPKEPGAPAADDHGGVGPPPAEVIARGYEADGFDNASVLSVPLLVVLFFVLAFGTVTVIFYFIAYPETDPRAHPRAVDRNKAPLNERLARIGRGKEVDQARLEPLTLRSGESRAITRPPLSEGNSPELHPEDLRATKDRYPELFGTGGGKIGIDKLMDPAAVNDKALGELFPVQKAGTAPADSLHVPTAANAGRGADAAVVVIPQTPTVPAPGAAPQPKGNPAPPPKPKDPPMPKGGK